MLLHKLQTIVLTTGSIENVENRKPNTNIKSLFFFAVLLNPSYYFGATRFSTTPVLFPFSSFAFKNPGRVVVTVIVVVVVS